MHEQECDREERGRRWLQWRKDGQRGIGIWQAHGLADINAPRGEAFAHSHSVSNSLKGSQWPWRWRRCIHENKGTRGHKTWQ